MPKLIDLTGKKIDKLTVIKKAPSKNRHTNWLCQCDCGNYCERTSEYLKKDILPRDCGCSFKKNIKIKENEIKKNYLVGKRFGKLVVLKNTNKSNQYGYLWLCQCDCGNQCEVGTQNLTSFHTQSCGCLKRESHWNDLTNQKFGLLTALYPIENKINSSNNSIYWHCKCDCGNFKDVASYNLRAGLTQSCGCINYSIGEYNIQKILKNNNINFITQYSNTELKLKRYDFAIIEENQIVRLVEFDGEQHYMDKKGMWNSKETLEQIQQKDKEKNLYAKENHIPLVRIPYWERDKITLDMIMRRPIFNLILVFYFFISMRRYG